MGHFECITIITTFTVHHYLESDPYICKVQLADMITCQSTHVHSNLTMHQRQLYACQAHYLIRAKLTRYRICQ